LGAGEFVIHQGLEPFVGRGPTYWSAIDEEIWGSLHAQLAGFGQIRVDRGFERVPVESLLELNQVQANSFCVFLQGWPLEILLVGEEFVMHLPELALGTGSQRRLCSQRRLVVEGERILPGEDPQLVGVLLEQSVEGGQDTAAVGTLEIGERDDGHRRLA